MIHTTLDAKQRDELAEATGAFWDTLLQYYPFFTRDDCNPQVVSVLDAAMKRAAEELAVLYTVLESEEYTA